MGLADNVQVTAILRHLRKHRPNWIIDMQSDRPSTFEGLVRNSWPHLDYSDISYDREIDVNLYDTFCAFTDRPNTRVTSCLHERFGMEWDRECGEYQVNVSEDSKAKAFEFLAKTPTRYLAAKKCFPFVCVHYRGDSSQDKKNLSKHQAAAICDAVLSHNRIPLLLDWRGQSDLDDGKYIYSVKGLSTREVWGRDAQMNAAIISQCEAFIGIDSGPGKCASATKTPTLIVWTGHHPALFHDPHPGTTHLVPANHREMGLLRGNSAVADWFEANYNWRTYHSDAGLVHGVKGWLSEVMG